MMKIFDGPDKVSELYRHLDQPRGVKGQSIVCTSVYLHYLIKPFSQLGVFDVARPPIAELLCMIAVFHINASLLITERTTLQVDIQQTPPGATRVRALGFSLSNKFHYHSTILRPKVFKLSITIDNSQGPPRI